MKVDDAGAARPAGPVPRDEVGAVGDGAAPIDGRRPGRRFRDALERGRPGSTGGDGSNDVASAAAMASWFRSEPTHLLATMAAGRATTGVASVNGARAVDQVLIGSGPEGAQARIHIGAGALAGTQILLSGGAAGSAVEARLLTQAASSRQTLSVVMDEIRSRLRGRGIVLTLRAAPERAIAPAPAPDTIAGEPARPAAGPSAGTRR